MTEHKIEYRNLDEIRPYDNNPRDNDAAVKPTAESIRQFGFQAPIIVDKDGVIIAGHTRYKAAKRLHLDKVPVIVAGELTPEQVKAYRIADNSTGEVARWNIELLTAELAGIKLDMSQFGLDLKLDTNTEVEDDGYEVEVPDAPITKPGDIWILGEHRVLCGSATDAGDMTRLMDGARADLLLTDPPIMSPMRARQQTACVFKTTRWQKANSASFCCSFTPVPLRSAAWGPPRTFSTQIPRVRLSGPHSGRRAGSCMGV